MSVTPNEIYNENCLDTMARMPDGYIDLTVTSPPYDNLRVYNDDVVWNEETWHNVIQELYRVTTDGGVVVWIVGDATIGGSETGTSFKQALWAKQCGFFLYDTMIYQKSGVHFPDLNRYYQCFEYMFIFSKGKPQTFNPIQDRANKTAGSKSTSTHRNKSGRVEKEGAKFRHRITKAFGTRFNIWKYETGWRKSYTDSWLCGHPAIFPEKLVRDHILSWSEYRDIVYDPFMGSGTTAKMALLTGRNYIGSEISEEYFKLAQRRVQDV